MSALNIITTRDGVHFFADTAGYDLDGVVVGFKSKLRAIPAAACVVGGIGIGEILQSVFADLSGARSLHEVVKSVPGAVKRATTRAIIESDLPGGLEIYAGGYVAGTPEIYALKVDIRLAQISTMGRVPPATWCFHPGAQQDGFAALGQHSVAVLEGLNRLGEQMPAAMLPEYAKLILQAQRHSRVGHGELNGGAGAYVVGGAAELMMVLPNGSIAAKCLTRWPDEVGARIDPSPGKDEAAA
jgi:hypothetical protein